MQGLEMTDEEAQQDSETRDPPTLNTSRELQGLEMTGEEGQWLRRLREGASSTVTDEQARQLLSSRQSSHKDAVDEEAHPLLPPRELKELLKLLEEPELDFLGGWRRNSTFLQGLNAKLVSGPFALIDGFLSETVADAVLAELQALDEAGSFVRRGPAFNSSSSGAAEAEAAYLASFAPRSRCSALRPGLAKRRPARSRYSSLAQAAGNLYPPDSPAIASVLDGLGGEAWAKALNLLLTGSGLRMPARSGLDVTLPAFRSHAPGDYMEVQNDADHRERRLLALHYWLMPSWRSQWGGASLWCGPSEDGRTFAAAERLSHDSNRATVFALHASTSHAMELIEAGAPLRFSFASFLRTAAGYIDVTGHQDALRLRQAQASLQRRFALGEDL